jgi:hypothetical protein
LRSHLQAKVTANLNVPKVIHFLSDLQGRAGVIGLQAPIECAKRVAES